jgi:hypothetical protein
MNPTTWTRWSLQDTRAAFIIASHWSFSSSEDRATVARALASNIPASRGLLRHSVFNSVEDLGLLDLFLWSNEADDDGIQQCEKSLRTAMNAFGSEVICDWKDKAVPYRRHIAYDCNSIGCLVLVRQPLERPDSSIQRSWVDTVWTALESDKDSIKGLCTANFFLSENRADVLSLSEWTSIAAHRDSLNLKNADQLGGHGNSPEWQATRMYPGIRSKHEMRRYVLASTWQVSDLVPAELHMSAPRMPHEIPRNELRDEKREAARQSIGDFHWWRKVFRQARLLSGFRLALWRALAHRKTC